MKKTPPLGIYKKIATSFLLLTIFLVVVIFYFSLSYVFISINPVKEKVGTTFNLLITENQDLVSPEKGVFEGVLVEQELEAEKEFPSTGTKLLKKDATGKVVIINNYSRSQPLVATTRLLTENNELFRISETIEVPAGGRVEVEAYQDDPSISVDIQPGQRFTIPGLFIDLQDFIYAEALTSFSGQEEEVKVVLKEDLDKAVDDLVESLKSQIIENLPVGTKAVLKPEIMSKEFSHLADEQTDKFTAKVKVRFEGVVFVQSEVDRYLKALVESSISDYQELVDFSPEMVDYQVSDFNPEERSVQLTGQVESQVVLRPDAPVLAKDNLFKMSKDQVEAYLTNLPEIESVEVNFFPFWVRKVPVFSDHIIINVNQN